MSGHSKWATTHRQKEVADAKKGAIFTKLGKLISIAARGGGNPETNFKLKLAVDKARAFNMPKDNIDRAIKKGTGELNESQLEEVIYEGFGPDGVAVVIECLTDNRNRTTADIKHILIEFGGSLGTPKSVAWQFQKMGVIRINALSDELELELIDAGASDIIKHDDIIEIYCPVENLQNIKNLLERKKSSIETAEIEMIPQNKKIVAPAAMKKLENFFNTLEENEDVNNYYTNAEI